jgi:ribosomal protein S18 acetylase RimI-like enzyme
MATLDVMTVPGSYKDIPGHEDLALMAAMMDKNDFAGLPAYVMRDGDKVVGIGIVDPDGYSLYAKLWCMEVAPGYRNKGYGSMILRKILHEYDDVKLVAKREAFPFYKRAGFVFDRGEPDPKSNVGYMVSRA